MFRHNVLKNMFFNLNWGQNVAVYGERHQGKSLFLYGIIPFFHEQHPSSKIIIFTPEHPNNIKMKILASFYQKKIKSIQSQQDLDYQWQQFSKEYQKLDCHFINVKSQSDINKFLNQKINKDDRCLLLFDNYDKYNNNFYAKGNLILELIRKKYPLSTNFFSYSFSIIPEWLEKTVNYHIALRDHKKNYLSLNMLYPTVNNYEISKAGLETFAFYRAVESKVCDCGGLKTYKTRYGKKAEKESRFHSHWCKLQPLD